MFLPQPEIYTDVSLLLLRGIVAVVFFDSGWKHMSNTKERSKSIGMSERFTFLLGVAELIGSVSILLGIAVQIGAIILIGVMLGAIYKKIFVWHTGFWGKKSMGWHYDLIFLFINLLMLFTAGGRFRLF